LTGFLPVGRTFKE